MIGRASILAAVLGLSVVQSQAAPGAALLKSAPPFWRLAQADYFRPACPQYYHYACRRVDPYNGHKEYCACWPTQPNWLYSPYGPYR
jgi:hypothetical protein